MTHPLLRTTSTIAVYLVLACLLGYYAIADPTGASILSASDLGTPTSTAQSRTDGRGTINYIVLSTLQQDQNWKAYVGNITGRLSLDDADGFTIYDWSLTGSVTGEVYVSRYASPLFTNVSCANQSTIIEEQTFFSMTATQSDNINNTYNYTSHRSLFIGGFGTIGANSCRSTATYVNDSSQLMDGNQSFQALVMQDNTSQAIYVTLISDNNFSYHNNISFNNTYDFQIIVPESQTNVTSTTYYFWTELG